VRDECVGLAPRVHRRAALAAEDEAEAFNAVLPAARKGDERVALAAKAPAEIVAAVDAGIVVALDLAEEQVAAVGANFVPAQAGRASEKGRSTRFEQIDLGDFLTDTIDLVRSRHNLDNGTVRFSPPASPITVAGDRDDLQTAFTNLLDNAVKYSHSSGTVDVALAIEHTQARVSVTDRGIGIAQEDQSRIFDRFYRTDNARTHTKKGTGLGLAICAWIVESHHGKLKVQSKIGEGSTFTVILPLAPASAKRLPRPS